MTTFMQDVQYALRQLRKTPGFTVTVLLTLALGIGANAAIFTLVNSVLLKRLPVADPKTLVRVGDNNDCCVTGGTKDNGDYGLFSTDTYEQMKKNLPEFEELAGIQAGFHYRPVTVRRDGAGGEPKSRDGRVCLGQLLPHVRAEAECGAVAGGRGRCAGRSDDGGDELRHVAARLCGRSVGDWKHVLGEYEGGDGGGDCAAGILWRPDVEHSAGLLSAD